MVNSLISTGRRKSAIVTVKLLPGNGSILINNISFERYLQYNPYFIKLVMYPLSLLDMEKSYDIIIQAYGGGLSGQAEAIKLAISKVIYKVIDDTQRSTFKLHGLLTRKSTCKERRKYGLKKARKAPQFSKR